MVVVVCCAFVCAPVWDYSIVATRISRDFSGNQDSYTTYLYQQIQGPWAAEAASWASCETPGNPACPQVSSSLCGCLLFWSVLCGCLCELSPPPPPPPGLLLATQEWSDESASLACTHAYTDNNGNVIKSGFDLGEDYYQFAWPVAEQQLAKASVRLAGLLNS